MAEATTIKKAVKRLRQAAEGIIASAGESRGAAKKEFLDGLEELEETWSSGHISPEEDAFLEVETIFENLRAADNEAFLTGLDKVLSFITTSQKLWDMKLAELNSVDAYSEILGLLGMDRPISLGETNLDILNRAARELDRYPETAIYLSEKGTYDRELFQEAVSQGLDLTAKAAILSNFLAGKNTQLAENFLGLLLMKGEDTWAEIKLIEIFEKENHEKFIEEIQKLEPEKITDLQDLRNVGHLLLQNDMPSLTVSFAQYGLKLFPEDYELLKLKGEALLRLNETVESYEIFKHLANRNNSDLGTVKNAINLAFSQKLYSECQQLIEAYPASMADPDVLGKKIECEISSSKFNEAIRDLDQALAKHPGDKSLLNLKLTVLIKLNKESEAFNLARDLMEKDPENHEATSYAMSWLFKRGEYDSIVTICEDNSNLKTKFHPIYVACEIYEDENKSALKELAEHPELMDSHEVVDSIFFNVRDDDFLGRLDDIYESRKNRTPYYKLVSNRLRGLRPRMDSLDNAIITGNTSQALAYIFSYEYFSTRNPIVPDRIRSMLYLPQFKEIRGLMDFLTQIYEGKFSDDVIDSSRFLFPLTEAYIKLGKLGKAETQLNRTSHSEVDPFYRYSIALIEFRKGEFNLARKYAESAHDRLRNTDFLKLLLNIALATDEQKKFREYLEEIVGMNILDFFDFSEIYLTLTKNKLWNMASILLSFDAEGHVRNPWIVRLRRDLALVNKEYKKAGEASMMLFSTNQYDQDDVFRQIGIYQSLGKSSEILNFLIDLETENRTIWLELLIGDTYTRSLKFHEALQHYSIAISLGADPEKIENYVTSLMEVGKYEESEALIKKTDNKLLQLKLLQKTSDIQGVIELLGKLTFKKDEDQEIVRYTVDNLWYNRDVRDFLVNLYKQEGYTWLGIIIATRTFESSDTKIALDVAKNLNKNNPEDLEIVNLYAELLIKSGQREDAIEVLLQSLKYCDEFSKGLNVTNTLLRLYYDDRDYEAVIHFYETNPKFVDERSLQFVIRSYMEGDNFDMAEKLMGRYEGTLLTKETHNELSEDLKTKKEFMETIFYVSRLLKLEYKVGKKFDKKEAFYKADIPIEQIEPVFQFLASRDFYFDVNEEKYEILTRDVIQKAAKAVDLESLKDLSISTIFNNLDRKDPVLARNIYIYIKDQMEIARRPKLKDETLLKLLRVALRENIKQETLHIAFFLKLGISEALDVMTLMEYMSKMNEEGEI